MIRPPQSSLINRLRSLPPPAVPPALEARLLAAIPSPAPMSRWRGIVAGLAALAACVLISVSLLRRPAPPPTPPKSMSAADVSIQLVQILDRTRETRPCDILPPLSSSL